MAEDGVWKFKSTLL